MASNSISDVCAYHRRDFDLVLVRSRPHETQLVQNFLQNAFKDAPVSGLGDLARLPNELLLIILRNLDLLSYFRFRSVNRQARVLVTEFSDFRLITKYGLEGLRGLLRGGIAPLYTVQDLYRALILEKCELCGRFGGFVFLLTVTRCCFACVRTSPDLRVIPVSALSKAVKISTKKLNRLLGPDLRTVPGLYSMEEKRVKRPQSLVAEQQAASKLHGLGLLDDDTARALSERNEQESHRFMASTAFPWYDPGSGEVEYGMSCKGCQIRIEVSGLDFDNRDRVYSRSEYIVHFDACEEARALWDQSNGGTKVVKEPEFTRRCGYFNVLDDDGLLR